MFHAEASRTALAARNSAVATSNVIYRFLKILSGMGWAVIHDHQGGFALLFVMDDCPSHHPQLSQGHFWSGLVGEWASSTP